MTVGERIKKRREELHLTQQQLADKMGYSSRSSIANLEKMGDNITTDRIEKFAEVLHTTPGALMGWGDEPEPLIPNILDMGIEIPKNTIVSHSERNKSKIDYIQMDVTKDEQALLEMYRKLPSTDKDTLKRVFIYGKLLSEMMNKDG